MVVLDVNPDILTVYYGIHRWNSTAVIGASSEQVSSVVHCCTAAQLSCCCVCLLSASRLLDKQSHFAFGHVICPNQNLFYNINTTLSSPNTSTRLMGKILQNLSATPTKYVVYSSYPVLYLTKCSW